MTGITTALEAFSQFVNAVRKVWGLFASLPLIWRLVIVTIVVALVTAVAFTEPAVSEAYGDVKADIVQRIWGPKDLIQARQIHADAIKDMADMHLERAQDNLKRLRSFYERVQGKDSQEVEHTLGHLRDVEMELGKVAEAQKIQERIIEIHRKTSGERGIIVANDYGILSVILGNQGKFTEAEDQIEKALSILAEKRGQDSWEYAEALRDLAMVRQRLGRDSSVDEQFRKCLEIQRKVLPPSDSRICFTQLCRANFLRDQSKFAEAKKTYSDLLKVLDTKDRAPDPLLRTTLMEYTILLHISGDDPGAQKVELRIQQLPSLPLFGQPPGPHPLLPGGKSPYGTGTEEPIES